VTQTLAQRALTVIAAGMQAAVVLLVRYAQQEEVTQTRTLQPNAGIALVDSMQRLGLAPATNALKASMMETVIPQLYALVAMQAGTLQQGRRPVQHAQPERLIMTAMPPRRATVVQLGSTWRHSQRDLAKIALQASTTVTAAPRLHVLPARRGSTQLHPQQLATIV
jgi:hypothetical protein